MIAKLLIANRGEIAVRVIRTAKRMGIRTVAVYSDADRNAPHVMLADEAVRIGPPAARDSYLRIDTILEAARTTGADAVHPGYGFLSENAEFAEACAAANIIFVGPPPAAIRAMGSKAEAKRIMAKAGVPLVPGYHGDAQDLSLLAEEANKIAYPVLLKAAMGGGGKGIRIVERAEDLAQSIDLVKREALAAFGDDRLILERYVGKPRHVEVQVFADTHGNVVHLFERDCTLQRRHQKIIEEAPAPFVPDAARRSMHEAAIAAARAINYVGAGTVEFLLAPDGAVYFMEMNTRLQVEHPVTEMITGLDLVEWQLRVAAGETLPLGQEQIRCTGHALEARLYAEDPSRDFLPSIGRLAHLVMPTETASVRIDSGVREGDEITAFYDPMIAKLIVHAPDRTAALQLLDASLGEIEVDGVRTNVSLLSRLARDGDVGRMAIDTHYVDRLQAQPAAAAISDPALPILAVLALTDARPRGNDPWDATDGWRLNLASEDSVELTVDGTQQVLTIERGESFKIGGHKVVRIAAEPGRIAAEIDGRVRKAAIVPHEDGFTLLVDGHAAKIAVPDPLALAADTGHGGGGLTAPMPGAVVAIEVEPGAKVTRGQTLLVLEAMKVHLPIQAAADGIVTELFVGVGDQVAEGTKLAAFEAAEG